MLLRKKSIHINDDNHNEIYAPLSGEVIELKDVNDEVFRDKMMGDGIAIIPKDGSLYSPLSGEITVVFPTKHVIGIKSEEGIQVIIHVGIDTVQLHGQGFHPIIKVGQRVKAGDLLMEFKLKKISRDYDTTTMIVIENSCDYHLTFYQNACVQVGDKIIKIERR